MKLTDADVPLIVRIIDTADPHLQEAGVRLARAALRTVDESDALEPPLARHVSREIDPWVLEPLVDLLALSRADPMTVYQGLAAIHRKAPRGWGITRNRAIQPWRRVVGVYMQHAIQRAHPKERDFTYLPILERELGTHGWDATQRQILATTGIDPTSTLACCAAAERRRNHRAPTPQLASVPELGLVGPHASLRTDT